MFVKVVPYYNQFCANWCLCCAVIDEGVVQNGTSNDNNNHSAVENGNLKGQPESTAMSNGASSTSQNGARTHVFQKVFRNPPNFVRFCCCWNHARNQSPSSSSSNQNKGTADQGDNDDDDGVTNVVPLDGGTIYTPMKNFIGRDELILDDAVGGGDGVAIENGHPQGQGRNVDSDRSRASSANSSGGPTTEELDKSEDENNGNNNPAKQQVSTHVQNKVDLDQRPHLSPGKSYGNSQNNGTSNGGGRFFGANSTIETPHRPRFLGEGGVPTAAGAGINQESYIIHRDEQYDSDNDEKSSNDSTSTRIISNSTFNFGGKGSDPYPPTTPGSIMSSRPQSVTSHKSIGSGILKSDGRLSRTSAISHSNTSLKQQSAAGGGDNVSIKSARSAKSRTDNEAWYERESTPVRSEDVISSNQVQYESDYDDEDIEEVIEPPKRTTTPKRYPTPSPAPLQQSYSTEELSNTSYHQPEEPEASPPPKSRVQSASLGNLQQLDDEEEPAQPAPPKKILKKPFLVRKSSKVAPAKETTPVGGSTKGKSKGNEVIFQKNLRKFEKPKDALANCIIHLESPNWEQNVTGLQIFVRLIRHHPEVIDSQIHLLSVALARQVRNLRSQVARAACQASAEFFSTHRRCIEGEAEDIATHLLHRTADTNKFLRADATQALESMCENLSNAKVIHIISFKGATHQNAVVRTTAAKMLDKIVHQIGAEKVFALPKESRDKLVLTGAQLLLEGSLETRNYTKSMFKQMSDHPSYNKVLLDVIPTRTYRNIEKSLKSIRQM